MAGRYCHKCGQENLEPKETVWHLVQHFFNDITHFDGKFFDTVKYLIKRPGFLSLEYMRGRRMAYLNPIRMYVFTSAFFFIILFSMTRPEDMARGLRNDNKTDQSTKDLTGLRSDTARLNRHIAEADDEDDREDYKERLAFRKVQLAAITKSLGDSSHQSFTAKALDSIVFTAYTDSIASGGDATLARSKRYRRAAARFGGNAATDADNFNFMGKPVTYETVEQYDSAEHRLPDSLRDDWFTHFLTRRGIVIRQEWHEDKSRFIEHLFENILHSFPKILWISLPIFAMILNILYFRHKKTYFYVNHGIFTIHVYCATFIQLFLGLMVYQIGRSLPTGWKVITVLVNFAIFLWMLIYLYKAMRGFYGQGRAKTLVKYFIVMSLMFFINLILLVLFLLISVFSV